MVFVFVLHILSLTLWLASLFCLLQLTTVWGAIIFFFNNSDIVAQWLQVLGARFQFTVITDMRKNLTVKTVGYRIFSIFPFNINPFFLLYIASVSTQ